MKILNKNSMLLITVLLVSVFFPIFAKQADTVSFKFELPSTFDHQDTPHSVPKPKSHATYKMRVLLADKVQRAWDNRYFLNLDLRTNLLYDMMLSPTLGFEWHINRYWSIKIDGSYIQLGSKHGMVDNILLVNPEVRRYINNTDRFYIGIGGNAGRINIYRGVIGGLFFPEDTGYQSSFFGGSISVGYKCIKTRLLTLDFNLGIGGTHFKYDSFTVIDKQRVYQRIKVKDVTKNLLGPTQAGVSLVWKISGHRNWR